MTTFKTGSVLTTGGDVGDTAPGFLITFSQSHFLAQAGIQFVDFNNAPVQTVPDATNPTIGVYGDYLSAIPFVFAGSIKLDGIRSPGAVWFPDGTGGQGLRMWSGSGEPTELRTVTNAVTNGTTTITSATINFTSSDVGRNISGTNIPSGTTIASVSNSTTAVMSAAATGSSGAGTLNIVATIGGAAEVGDLYIRIDTPTTSNQRVYQCTTAGTPGTWTARY